MKIQLGKLIAPVMAAGLIATPAFAADDYVIDSAHTLVAFELNHLGFSKSIGWMGDVSGTISYDADDVAKSAVSVIMAVASVNTNHPERDGWIKSDKALNVAANPEITFASTGIEVTSETTGKIMGDLTMNGVSKPVVLDAVFNGSGPNPLSKKETIGVSATTSIMRSDWGVTAFVGPLGDEIAIQIELEAVKAE
ncbi:YceI family protein [Ascidiaceihabitans sp.]|uniref:YceI family protein n=1 Tax=Ascidiaceihabitans sp. TaxID=1872644 RepID=UPI003297CB3B